MAQYVPTRRSSTLEILKRYVSSRNFKTLLVNILKKMSDTRNEKKKPSKRLKQSSNTEKVKRKTEKENISDIIVKKRSKKTARDENNDEFKPVENEPKDPPKPMKGKTEEFENRATSSETTQDQPTKDGQEKETIRVESKTSQKKRIKCPLPPKYRGKCCKRNKRENKKTKTSAPENGAEMSSKRLDITEEKINPNISSSETKRIPPPTGYQEKEPIRTDRRQSYSQEVNISPPMEYYEYEDGDEHAKRFKVSEERTKPGTSFSKAKRVLTPKGYRKREPRLVVSNPSYSKAVDTPRPLSYDEYQDGEEQLKPLNVSEERTKPGTLRSKGKRVPPLKGFQEREPLEVGLSYSDNVDILRSKLDNDDEHREETWKWFTQHPNINIPEPEREETLRQLEESDESIKPGTSPKVKRVPPRKASHEREPSRVERRRFHSKNVDTPRPLSYQDGEEPAKRFEVGEERIKPRTSKDKRVPSPKAYHQREPTRVERRKIHLKNVGTSRPPSYDGKEPSTRFEVSKEKIKPRISPWNVKHVPPPKRYYERSPVVVNKRRSYGKDVETPRPMKYDEYQEVEAVRTKPGTYDGKKSARRKYNKEESDDSATPPCKPCSAEGGLQRFEIRVINPEREPEESDDSKRSDAVSIIRFPKERNVLRCDNEKCPSNIERRNKNGGQKRRPDEPAEGNYDDDVDVIYLCANKDCSERSSTDLIGGLARCGSNRRESSGAIELYDSSLRFVGDTKKKESRKVVNYDDFEVIEPLYSNRHIKEVRTIFITDPRLLQQSSNYEFHFDEIGRDSRKELNKKYTYLISPPRLVDCTESSYSSHSRSENQQILYPTESVSVYCREARNEVLISWLFTILLILFILFIFLPIVR